MAKPLPLSVATALNPEEQKSRRKRLITDQCAETGRLPIVRSLRCGIAASASSLIACPRC
jgi:hypothetical protein